VAAEGGSAIFLLQPYRCSITCDPRAVGFGLEQRRDFLQALQSIAAAGDGSQSLQEPLKTALPQLARDTSASVRYELAWVLASLNTPEKPAALLQLAQQDATSPWMHAAMLAATGDAALDLFTQCARDPASAGFAHELAGVIGGRNRPTEVAAVLTHAVATPDPAAWLAPLADGLARAKSSLSAVTGTGAGRILALSALNDSASLFRNSFACAEKEAR